MRVWIILILSIVSTITPRSASATAYVDMFKEADRVSRPDSANGDTISLDGTSATPPVSAEQSATLSASTVIPDKAAALASQVLDDSGLPITSRGLAPASGTDYARAFVPDATAVSETVTWIQLVIGFAVLGCMLRTWPSRGRR